MKNVNTRILGAMGIIGAPWIFIDFIHNGLYEHFLATSTSGIRNFLFMTGWLCSVYGLYQLHAMGTKRWQRAIIIIQLILLVLADCWSIFEMFAPDSQSTIFYLLNFLWPVSGFFMVITGIVILQAKRLPGWKRYMPLLAGLWFPEMFLVYTVAQGSLLALIISGMYSTIVFGLMGLSVFTYDFEAVKRRTLFKS